MSILNKIFSDKKSLSIDSGNKDKLHSFAIHDGLYRNTDGSVPTLLDFTELGFSKDEYFQLVYGVSQSELQNKVMLPTRIKRNMRIGVMNNRIKANMAKKNKPKAPKSVAKAIVKSDQLSNTMGYSMFAPYGVFGSLSSVSNMNKEITNSLVLGFGFFYEHINSNTLLDFDTVGKQLLDSPNYAFDQSFEVPSHTSNSFDSHHQF